MEKEWVDAFLLHSKSKEYKEKVRLTVARIKEILEKYDKKIYCACSGGKDSLVLTHLTLSLYPEIEVFHFDHGPYLMPRKIENEILGCIKSLGIKNLTIKTSPKLAKKYVRWEPIIWYQEFFKIVKEYMRKKNLKGVMLGFREEESLKRKRRILNKKEGEEFPILDWSYMDIWAYIVQNKIKYPSLYNKYGKLLGYDRARLVTLFDEEFKKYGSVYFDRVLYPELENLYNDSL